MEVLAAITPNDVLRYMNLRTIGAMEPTRDANPTSAHANTLAMDKKAISFVMPNRDIWSMTRAEGNPTRSALVNSLIKRVKKNVLSAGPRSDNAHDVFWKRYGILAMTKFQFHLIARVDDSTQLVLEHIRVHDTFTGALKTRLNWSKNVDDE